MKRTFILSLALFGCSERAVGTGEFELPEQPTELELLCADWCDTQYSCGHVGDYAPEGDCIPNCVESRGWNVAWEGGCEGEVRETLTCLATSRCEEVQPIFDSQSTGSTPCDGALGAVLQCTVSGN